MTKFGDNPTVEINRENLLSRIERHSFSKHHLQDGLMEIGSKDYIKNSAVDVIFESKGMLRSGQNYISTNIDGHEVTVTAFVRDKTVVGANIWRNVKPQHYNNGTIIFLAR